MFSLFHHRNYGCGIPRQRHISHWITTNILGTFPTSALLQHKISSIRHSCHTWRIIYCPLHRHVAICRIVLSADVYILPELCTPVKAILERGIENAKRLILFSHYPFNATQAIFSWIAYLSHFSPITSQITVKACYPVNPSRKFIYLLQLRKTNDATQPFDALVEVYRLLPQVHSWLS